MKQRIDTHLKKETITDRIVSCVGDNDAETNQTRSKYSWPPVI